MEHLIHDKINSSIKLDSAQSQDLWLVSSLAIVTMSLCGMLCLFLVPLMQNERLLQFLVSMAIGTMSGDAFLHLLPHAMISDHLHMRNSFWKGIAGKAYPVCKLQLQLLYCHIFSFDIAVGIFCGRKAGQYCGRIEKTTRTWPNDRTSGKIEICEKRNRNPYSG